FCFGHKADRVWTVGEWLGESGAYLYYELSDLHTELISYAANVLEGRRWMSERTARMMMTILFSPEALRSKLGISVEDVDHEEFYRRRMKALKAVLAEMAAGFGFGPQAATFLEGGNPQMSVMDRMKNILAYGQE
ncbi:MAG: YkgJ family cysteine cluster protein, partial [Firmicutes bacterium]|nr:YkgJ family cysteine cluster protein [Bacillota bacterium]